MVNKALKFTSFIYVGTAWARHGRGMGAAWARHAMCESALIGCSAAYFRPQKVNIFLKFYILSTKRY